MKSPQDDPIRSHPQPPSGAPEHPQRGPEPIGGVPANARGVARPAGRWFAVLASLSLVFGVYINTFHLSLYSMVVHMLVGVVALPLVFGFGAAWAIGELRGLGKLAGSALVLMVCAAFVALAVQQTSFRLAASISRPAMEELVDRVRAGESVDVPTRAGLFVVREVKTKGPVVALVIRDNPSGDCALVHFPNGSRGLADVSGHESQAFYGPMYNLNMNLELGGGWRYQTED
ncbi:MAG: hypothetical protein GC161_19520 [Planctomycetaceae bacterium]|nr:hypothetical protein [Planctomycetaceae bacterium]